MITIEEIKSIYPEGCEVSCAIRPADKQVVSHKDIRIGLSLRGNETNIRLIGEHQVHLWDHLKGFATITKLSPPNTITPLKSYIDKNGSWQMEFKKEELERLFKSYKQEEIITLNGKRYRLIED